MKVGLYTVSFSGAWYDGSGLPLAEIFRRAKKLIYTRIVPTPFMMPPELGAKRPQGSPMDLDERARARIRQQADKLGLEIPAVAGYNNFASPIVEQRENELLMAREQIKLT